MNAQVRAEGAPMSAPEDTDRCEGCQEETRYVKELFTNAANWSSDLQRIAGVDLPEDLLRGVVKSMAFALDRTVNEMCDNTVQEKICDEHLMAEIRRGSRPIATVPR
jgi:hypothetical protein